MTTVDDTLDVLVVDSRDADVALIRHHLDGCRGATFRLDARASLTRALHALEHAAPDLILTELVLPDRHGLAVFESLRDAAPGIPVVVLTGTADNALAMRAASSGVQDFLVKGELEADALGRRLLQARIRGRAQADATRRLQSLESEHTQLRNLLHLHPDGLLVVDAGGVILFANEKAAQLLDEDADDPTGQTFVRPDTVVSRNWLQRTLPAGTTVHVQPTGWHDVPTYLVTLRRPAVTAESSPASSTSSGAAMAWSAGG